MLTEEPPQALFQLANAFLSSALLAFLFASWERSEFRARESAGGRSRAVGEGMLSPHRLSRLRSCLLVADPFAAQGDGDVERHFTVPAAPPPAALGLS